MRDRFDPDIITGAVCPYCGNPSEYMDSKSLYGKSYGMLYRCKPCDAHVGVHNRTSKHSLGRLADRRLRKLKKLAHSYFDPLWKKAIKQGREKRQARADAYRWLPIELGIDNKFCHIGFFDTDLCQRTIKICKKYYK